MAGFFPESASLTVHVNRSPPLLYRARVRFT